MKKPPPPQWTPAAPVVDNARRELPLMVRRFLTDGDRSLRPNTPLEKLHEFRLSAKRLRYTLEAFKKVYGPSLDRYIEAVRSIQTALGELNDCRATAELLDHLPPQPETAAFKSFLEARQQEKRAAFERAWAHRFADKAFRQAFVRYLRTYTRAAML